MVKIVVTQIGPREHYAVAQALHQRGMLAGLVTDWYAFGWKSRKQKAESEKKFQLSAFIISTFDRLISAFSVSVFQHFGRCGRAALAARCEAIPDALVRAFLFRSLLWKWRVRRMAARGHTYDGYLETDRAFGVAVARLKLPPHDVFFGYSYASLEAMVVAQAQGKMTVLCQIDPGPVHFRIVAGEMARHPALAGPPQPFPDAYFARSRREWELADVIVVNSEWTREALVAEGVAAGKIEILPLAYEAEEPEDRGQRTEDRSQRTEDGSQNAGRALANSENTDAVLTGMAVGNSAPSGLSSLSSVLRPPSSAPPPLRVLWLGQVTPGKGIHYLMEAARLLEGEPVHFDVVGSIGIRPAAVAAAPENMTFHGAVSRDRVADWYRQSDVFVLPTLSDGFALTQLEALSHGLPVITTPNCGRVVEDGKTGFIIPPRGAIELAGAILKFSKERQLSEAMAPACRAAVKQFSIDTYGDRLVGIVHNHLAAKKLKEP